MVIAILAVLSVAVVVIINPAEFIKRGRDSTRLSDLTSLNRALGLLLSQNYDDSFGDPNIVYTSLPDTDDALPEDCDEYSLPSLPDGWSYSCRLISNFRNVDGSGWTPVDLTAFSAGSPLAVLPVDPVNDADSLQYYLYMTGGSWKLHTLLESSKYTENARADGGTSDHGYELGSNLAIGSHVFPSGWVRVPGSSTYGTSDFWVMKYEAKCVLNSAPTVGLISPVTSYRTYYNTTTPCVSANGRTIASLQSGYPIAYISHNNAKIYCSNLGTGFHLMTNEEWMTVARNAEQVAGNWTSGSVGSGALFLGHNDNNPSKALVASSDNDPYSGTVNSSPSNQKRTFTLSNESVIWDIAGNVWEHVQRSLSDTLVRYTPSDGGAIGWRWIEHTAMTSYGDLSYNELRPSNSSWNATQGMGRVYTYNGDYGSQTLDLRRGGSWYSGTTDAGAFTSYLFWGTGPNYYAGFRCAK